MFSYISIHHPNILDVHIVYIRNLSMILAKRAHRLVRVSLSLYAWIVNGEIDSTYLAVCSIAIHGIHVKVRAVRLGGETVVVDVYPGPLDIHTRCIHSVHEIGIFGDNTPVVGKSCCNYIVVTDIVRADDEVIPARRILEMNARDLQIGSILSIKQDRSVVLIIGVENPIIFQVILV